MFIKSFLLGLFTVVFLMTMCLQNLSAQTWDSDKPVRFIERNMGGPRLGVTYIPGNGELVQKLKDKNLKL